MKMINYAFLSVVFACTGCVSATVSDSNICDMQSIDFGTVPSIDGTPPNVSVTISLPPQSTTMNLSDSISKIDSVADQLQVAITQLVITSAGDGGSDLSWVKSADVQIEGSASDGSTPMMELGSADASMQVQVKMSPDQVLHYLSSGPVTLTVALSGVVDTTTIPHGEIINNVNLCVSVSGHFSKSL
jgi:hypothetical protein